MVLVSDVLVAALLILAGVSKLYSPQHLRRALMELFPGPISRPIGRTVRPLALVEIAGGCGLLALPSRPFAAGVVVGLGVAFLIAGVLGVLRGSTLACGCFAGPGGKPLGWRNVLAGLALAVLAGLNLLVPYSSPVHRDSAELSTICTAVLTVLLACWLHRTMIRELLPWPSTHIRVVAK